MIDSYETPKRPPILPWSQQPVFDPKVPSEKEVRYLGNHHRKCRYYMQGKIFIPLMVAQVLSIRSSKPILKRKRIT